MPEKCPIDGTELVSRKIQQTRHVGEYAFTARLSALVCKKCKDSYVEGRDLERFDSRVALILAQAGIRTPPVLQFLRKAMGLQGKEFAKLLGVRPETVSRWEQGKGPIDRASYAVIRQILTERQEGTQQMIEYLASLGKPKALATKVQVRLPKAG